MDRTIRIHFVYAALATLVLVPTPRLAQAGDNSARLQGLRLYDKGRYAEAIPYFSQVLSPHSRDIEIFNKRGVCFLKLNQPELALKDFDQIIQHEKRYPAAFGKPAVWNPSSTWAPYPSLLPSWGWVYYPQGWGNRGIALLMLGRDQEALTSFQVALDRWSASGWWFDSEYRGMASAYEGVGEALKRMGRPGEAFNALNQAVSLNPRDPVAFVGRGDLHATLGRYAEAALDYSRALALDGRNPRAHRGLGIARAYLGRDSEALGDLNHAIELDQRDAFAYSNRGALLAQRGANEAALADYDALIKLAPGNAGAYKDKGGVLTRMGRHREAIVALNQAITLDSSKAASYQNRGAAYRSLGQYEHAIRDLDRAIALDPKSAGAYSNRGLARFGTGEYDLAVQDLDKAIELAPQAAIPYFNRADVLARLGDRGRALKDYERAVELEPRLAAAHAALARLHDADGDSGQAAHELDRAIELDPRAVGLLRQRGDLRRESGEWTGALADYDRAIALDPHDPTTYLSRGWARLAAGVDGADRDARVFLKIQGYHDAKSPMMALLAVLGAKAQGRKDEAARSLDEAIVNVPVGSWPSPVFQYLRGTLNAKALVSDAGPARAAEAHAYLGLERLWAGEQANAIEHLREAAARSPHGIAGDLARATLKRIQAGPTSS